MKFFYFSEEGQFVKVKTPTEKDFEDTLPDGRYYTGHDVYEIVKACVLAAGFTPSQYEKTIKKASEMLGL